MATSWLTNSIPIQKFNYEQLSHSQSHHHVVMVMPSLRDRVRPKQSRNPQLPHRDEQIATSWKLGFLNIMDSSLNPLSHTPFPSTRLPNIQYHLNIDAFHPCMYNASLEHKLGKKWSKNLMHGAQNTNKPHI